MSSSNPTDTVDRSSTAGSSNRATTLIHQRTIDNIKENYRREFASSSKYALYAKQLQEQGYESLASLFYACSHSECIHSVRHSRVAMFLGIKLEMEVVKCEKKPAVDILNEM
ncbi:MAG: ferritin family protein, partial [Planctomycetia bacterium]|nr:ferritin family protein [Planctomycetia bacterium]